MKYIIGVILLVMSSVSNSQDKETFLAAWENAQENSDQLELFEKTAEGKYKIKFVTLPYDGELVLLAYDVDKLGRGQYADKKYTMVGYVEIDLVDAPDDIMRKYGRTYSKWFQTNTLYFNDETGSWVTSKDYGEELIQDVQSDISNDFVFIFFKYWNYILALIILYFLVSQIQNSKRMKESYKVQTEAVTDMRKTIKLQNESMGLHKETNEILGKILSELKEKK